MADQNASQRKLFEDPTLPAGVDSSPRIASAEKNLRAPVAWYGGKAYYADWLIARFPSHRVYVEPFGGAANVLLRKPPSEVEVYNDLDERIVNLFRVIRDPATLENLHTKLELTPYSRAEFWSAIQAHATDDPIEKARCFFVACRQARGGIGMSTRSKSAWAISKRTRREMAEPVSKYLSAIDGLADISARFRTVMIESRDAIELLSVYDGLDTFFYLDPPYMPQTRYARRADTYGKEMTIDDHRNLLGAVRNVRGRVMLSGYATPLYDETLQDWTRVELAAKAMMANSGSDRTEVVWMNYDGSDIEAVSSAACG